MDIYKLSNGDSIKIAPDYGCNLFSWTCNGREVFYTPEDFPGSLDMLNRGGNPILFPAVGRTWDCSMDDPMEDIYQLHGHESKLNMPIHGILSLTEWERLESVVTPEKLALSYKLMIPEIVKEMSYPFDVDLVTRFELTPGVLKLTAQITNTDTKPVPCAFGYHPYFAISDCKREEVRLSLPVTGKLVLDPELLVPSGLIEQAEPEFSLETGVFYDSVYTGINGPAAKIFFGCTGRSLAIDFSEDIENLVLYAGANTPAVCVEPWTKGLGGFSKLMLEDWQEGRDILVLSPGEQKNIEVTITVSD